MNTPHLSGIATLCMAFALAGCGVDMTGLSADSSRTVKGSANALVTVTEYADLQCPSCADSYTLINKPLLEKYGSKIRFVFKHFPLRTIHQYAFEAAQASECAADQGKFWEFIDLAYVNQKDLSSDALREWGTKLGLDKPLFDRCIRSGIKGDTILKDYAEGEKLGVQGTPTYFVNGVQPPQRGFDALSAAVDAALKGATNVPL